MSLTSLFNSKSPKLPAKQTKTQTETTATAMKTKTSKRMEGETGNYFLLTEIIDYNWRAFEEAPVILNRSYPKLRSNYRNKRKDSRPNVS